MDMSYLELGNEIDYIMQLNKIFPSEPERCVFWRRKKQMEGHYSRLPKICLPLIFLFIATLFATIAQQPEASAQTPQVEGNQNRPVSGNQTSERYITIDFNNVDIVVFIKFISELTGKNFIIDQRVRGKVTIISPSKISLQEAYKVFESVLEVHGYTTAEAGEVIKILPSPDARTKSIETRLKEEADSPEDKVITQLIPLKYANPADIKRLFAPMISKSSIILDYPPTNVLIVTDVHSNIKRLLRILKAIDVAGIGQQLSVIPLEFADAQKFSKLLDTVFKAAIKPKKGQPVSVARIVADERTNTLIILASELDTQRIKKLISMLDVDTPRGKEKIRVYYLENAYAEDLAKVLQELPTKQKGTTPQQKTAPVVSEQVRISADKATNSLIIMADKEDYVVIEDIIKKLDIEREMVYIESLFMEVKVDTNFRLGVDWRAIEQISYGNRTGVAGGAFDGGGAIEESDLENPGGFALGVITGSIDIVTGAGTITVPNLTAIAQAFQTDENINILSTPQILTTDNEEARIVVGENVPYQTRSSQISGTSDTFSSFEYRDVGLTLKITPHISKDRQVRLVISQELTALTTSPEETDFRPTTLKRSIDTTVVVKDKSTVVIGGLIGETITRNVGQVPCLGNIPGLKWLFRSQSTSNEKTNLYIFLKPTVIVGQTEASELFNKKRNQIDRIKEGQIKMYENDIF